MCGGGSGMPRGSNASAERAGRLPLYADRVLGCSRIERSGMREGRPRIALRSMRATSLQGMRSGLGELALEFFDGALQRIASLGQRVGKRRIGMDAGPALLGLNPAFELTGCFFEAGNRGFHLRDPTARFGDTCLVQAIELFDISPITVLAWVTLCQR